MATKIGNLGFSEEDDFVLAPIDHQRPRKSLRPFIPEIISAGGGISGAILSLLQEKHFEKHDQSLKKFSFILAEDDQVDTTLTLSTAVSRISSPSILNPIPLQKNCPNFDEDHEVETTLTLSKNVSRESTDPLIYNPTPLRCFPPQIIPEASATSPKIIPEASSTSRAGKSAKAAGKRKREDGDVGQRRAKRSNNGGVGTRRGRRSNNGGGEDQRPLLPSVEEFPALVRALESRNGSRTVFLYRKKLVESDVRGDLDRLFVTGREPLMRFLTAEEAAALDGSKQGLRILGVDQFGKAYNLGLKKWGSLNMTVINAEWCKLVAANGAGKDDLVEIWGFRDEDGKLGFAIIFGRRG